MTTRTTRSPVASSAPTPTFESVISRSALHPAVQSEPQRAQVYLFDAYVREPEAVPVQHVSVDTLAERWSADPERQAALVRARRWLAELAADTRGETIRSLRLRSGLSQAQLAASISTSQSHIARIERGTENVTIDTCRRLAVALDIDMNTLDLALRRQEARVTDRGSKA